MTTMSPDCDLVSAYAKEGSEGAFRALAARHVDLVFATALRQVGDAGIAEDITQNVFVALARKAPRLGGIETLAGWLHRTTILEAKARIRTELRRRRREEAAAELIAMEHQGASPLEALVPLLDEALLTLRDGDRLALVLRFLEDRSLREVGAALGVEEDAARKRVDRALARLTGFFRKRGFALSAAGGGAALLGQAAQAAPAGLAVSAAQAGLAAGAAASGINLVLFHLMSLTKTQTAVACLLVAAVPLTWQWQAGARLAREHDEANDRLAQASRRADEIEDDLQRVRADLLGAQAATLEAERQRDLLNARRTGQAPVPHYQWDDNSPLVRVPKAMLAQLNLSAVANGRGELSEQIKEALQMTEAESETVQAAINRSVAAYHAARAATMRKVEPNDEDRRWHPDEEVRVFEMPDISAQFKPLRAALFGEIAEALGRERSEFFRKKLQDWMPVDDGYQGLSTGRALVPEAHRVRFAAGNYGFPALSWALSKDSGYVSAPIRTEEIPDYLRPELQDWIAAAQSKSPLK